MPDSTSKQTYNKSKACDAPSFRVAVIEPVGGYGGMDFYNHQLCESLTDAGCSVLLFTSSGYRSRTSICRHLVVDSFVGVFGKEAKWRRAVRYLGAVLHTLFVAHLHGVRLAHYHIFHVGIFEYINILLARATGLTVIVTAHDVGSFRVGERLGLLRKIYNTCGAVIAHSRTAQNTLINTFGVKAQKVHYIPHGNYAGLLPELPEKQDARKRFGLNERDVVVLFFGQCKKVKRLDLLIEAIAAARERGASRLKLLVAGNVTDVDGDSLMRQMQCRLPNAAIHHARYIPNEEMPAYFAAADVAALPYDQIFQSGVVLLAMTYGVPVLASDIEGMVEIVKNQRTGLNFRVGDVEDLTQRLIEIERGDWALSDFARTAKAHVLTHHSWELCGNMTADVYRQTLNAKRGLLT